MAVATQPFTGTFVADPAHSSFQFAITHMSVTTFRANFDDVDARVVVDEQGTRLSGAARADSVSIKAPAEFREHVVYSAEFFDARNHPEIRFGSQDVRFGDDGTVTLDGELTIKGITKPFSASGRWQPPVEDPYGSTRAAVELEATVDRRDWDMTWQAPLPKGGDVLGYDVRLSAHVELVKEA